MIPSGCNKKLAIHECQEDCNPGKVGLETIISIAKMKNDTAVNTKAVILSKTILIYLCLSIILFETFATEIRIYRLGRSVLQL
jgi:hypothetical protein